jgi:hypothetical protein
LIGAPRWGLRKRVEISKRRQNRNPSRQRPESKRMMMVMLLKPHQQLLRSNKTEAPKFEENPSLISTQNPTNQSKLP